MDLSNAENSFLFHVASFISNRTPPELPSRLGKKEKLSFALLDAIEENSSPSFEQALTEYLKRFQKVELKKLECYTFFSLRASVMAMLALDVGLTFELPDSLSKYLVLDFTGS